MRSMQILRIVPFRQTSRLRGFTAIELMVTLAVLAVLIAIAAPSFTPIIERWRVRQASEDIQSSIYMARSEAIKRGGNVTFAANGSSWADGWKVASGSTTLQQAPATNGVTVTAKTGATAATSFSVNRWGMLTLSSDLNAAVSVNILITPAGKNGTSPNATLLCVGTGGRIEAKTGASQSC